MSKFWKHFKNDEKCRVGEKSVSMNRVCANVVVEFKIILVIDLISRYTRASVSNVFIRI